VEKQLATEKNKGKYYTRISRGNYSLSLKAPKDKYPKRLQLAFYQLKLGKDFFKSFSKTIGKDKEGRYFKDYRAI